MTKKRLGLNRYQSSYRVGTAHHGSTVDLQSLVGGQYTVPTLRNSHQFADHFAVIDYLDWAAGVVEEMSVRIDAQYVVDCVVHVAGT